MNRVFFVVFLIDFCLGHEAQLEINLYKYEILYNARQELVQIGNIKEFVLDQGHPFKKSSTFGYTIIQQGKLKEFILDQGYPSKIKPNQTISNFKIIREY